MVETILAAEVIDRLLTMLWPFLRIGALLMVAPVLSIDAVTVRIRLAFGFVLTAFVYPFYDWPVIDPTTAAGLLEVFNQITIGVLMGLILQVVVAAIVVGGQTISAAMGLSMASLLDPAVGNVPTVSSFLLMISSLLFLALGGHVLLLELLLTSFDFFPIGRGLLSQDAFGHFVAWSSMMFTGAVLLALPVMIILLAVNIGMGIIVRAAPQLNIFAVGIPLTLLAGLVIFYVLVG
ncbi:MAG: flagellar biosynthetic protein FliR, partial [Betaproteobacteria bacterium]|nr:flagellar biosynthetic protein FliR [Betaproteobacteria bacterium]